MLLHSSQPTTHKPQPTRQGYVLIAVLIVVSVLALMAYRFTDSMTAEYRAGSRTADAARARAAAVSGVHYAAAMLADRDLVTTQLSGDPTADNPTWTDVTVWADPKNSGRDTKFRIIAIVPTGAGIYERRAAVTDEGGKLNINALIAQDKNGNLLYNALTKIPNMTPDIAANIVDWVDADDTPGSGAAVAGGGAIGAENSHYQSLGNPYKCKNGPLNSLDELLLVKDVTAQLLYGTDQNRNGISDDTTGGGGLDRGWSDYLTTFGRDVSVDSTGQLKVWINGDSPKAIYDALKASGIGDEASAYIMAVKLWGSTRLDAQGNPIQGKGQPPAPTDVEVGSLSQLVTAVETKLESTTSSGRAINSIYDLLFTRVNLPRSGGGGGKGKTMVYNSPLNDSGQLSEVLPKLLDKLAAKEAVELVPRLNVNTAPREVIAGLPGLEDADVDAIMSARDGLTPGELSYTTAAWLATSANLTKPKLRAIETLVTGSSMVYRVQSVGYSTPGNPVARVEAVIDTNLGAPRIVYFRDLADLDSPRLFQPQANRQK